MEPTATVVAKVTDFGETRGLLLKLKGRENLLNPSWLAPDDWGFFIITALQNR